VLTNPQNPDSVAMVINQACSKAWHYFWIFFQNCVNKNQLVGNVTSIQFTSLQLKNKLIRHR
jgi:hypothetical protein